MSAKRVGPKAYHQAQERQMGLLTTKAAPQAYVKVMNKRLLETLQELREEAQKTKKS